MHFTKNLTCNTVIQGLGPISEIQVFFRTRLVSTHLLMVCINIATAHFFSSIATIENKVDTNYVSASPFSYLI